MFNCWTRANTGLRSQKGKKGNKSQENRFLPRGIVPTAGQNGGTQTEPGRQACWSARMVGIYRAGYQRELYRYEASEICTGSFGQILSWVDSTARFYWVWAQNNYRVAAGAERLTIGTHPWLGDMGVPTLNTPEHRDPEMPYLRNKANLHSLLVNLKKKHWKEQADTQINCKNKTPLRQQEPDIQYPSVHNSQYYEKTKITRNGNRKFWPMTYKKKKRLFYRISLSEETLNVTWCKWSHSSCIVSVHSLLKCF